MNIKISILMPFYNAEAYLSESLESILNQTFEDFELLAIDDGSTDNSVSIVKSFDDKRIRLISLDHNFIESLNYGLKVSKGKYIVRMDADDIMLPKRLEVQHNFMEANLDIDVCGSWAERFGNNRGTIKYESEHEGMTSSLLLYCCMIHPTVIIRKTTLDQLGLNYLDYPYAEDYKLWTDLSLAGARFATIREVLLQYRFSSDQVTSKYRDTMSHSSYKIRMEYAEALMNRICEEEEQYLGIFEQAIQLLDLDILDFESFCQIVFHLYSSHLKKDESL
jgi:glycosyltransferase involved in cell wall biosynthesis